MPGVSWVQGEIAFLTKVVNSIDFNKTQSTYCMWEPIAQAMTAEQPKHRPGGELFEQDPWPQRECSVQEVFSQGTLIEREVAAQVQAVADLKALEEMEIPEEVAREVEEEMERVMKVLDGLDIPEYSEEVMAKVEEELIRLRHLWEAKPRDEDAQ
ncbi:hypothetical protein EAF04_005223 [Stromatinia cepivora]|nr:hypothetical protein EAF04_005223 [Stromatinia cepivora]